MGMAVPTYWTAQMVRQLPDDGNRYEVVHGELLVTPAPRPWHEIVVDRLHGALQEYLRAEPVGFAFGGRSDISWGSNILVEPDVFVVPLEEARALEWARMKSLLLAAEVLSPSSIRYDRFTKRRLYQAQGILVYWVVDADERYVEVWCPDDELPAIERERVVWHPAGAGQAFTLELAELFRPV